MSGKLKLYIGRKILNGVRVKQKILPVQISSLIEIGHSSNKNDIEMNLPVSDLERCLEITNINQAIKLEPDDIVKDIKYTKENAVKKVCFKINRNIFIKDVVENCNLPDINSQERENIIVEFSSPNIAKPFHVGHLRSTIIGNFIANLHSYLNHQVTRLNYLGDWGTQFGLIKVGVEKLKYSEEVIKSAPLKTLYDSYVYANKLAETDGQISELARKEFAKLESGSENDIANWKKIIDFTIDDLKSTYKRLGVKFDAYNYESMYSSKYIQNIINDLQKNNILQLEAGGKQIVRLSSGRNVTLIKSDGTTLYLTRDIAAAIDRHKRYNFNKMLYIVENGQNDHFEALKDILRKLDLSWANSLQHVKFGRIHGMSTRKGTAVFLKDILDESKELMVQKQIKSPNTKVPVTDGHISDILGVSCVIISDLKQRRQKDYDFKWDKVLQVNGDSGVKLQYTHCRLCSLEKNCGVLPAHHCIPEILHQYEVTVLVQELGRFHDVLYKAQNQLEACVLVTYLFQLCHHINRALKVLKVKDEEISVGSQRLLLFNKARNVLAQGMMILGLQPLKEM